MGPILNDRQHEAVTSIDGPMLIIAGAGSGKTRVITHRMAYMLERGIKQSEILGLTFTNKAAREMEERVRGLTGKPLRNLIVSTFHAFGVQILRKEIARLGYKQNFSIYDQSDQMSLIRQVAVELAIPRDGYDAYTLTQVFSAIKTGRAKWTDETEEYRPLYDEYLDHCRLYNAVDFDDLIILPIRLFEESPEVLESYRSRFRYLMVDEFQDTSLLQYRILRLLALEHRNLCVVGDDDQSIYSWRGANFQNIVLFETDFPERREIMLEQNYRSTRNILSAANEVISNNKNRKTKSLWTGTEGGTGIEVHFPDTESDEGIFIAESIGSLMAREKMKYHDFGVLVRTNSLTATLEDAFLANNIPYRVSGGTGFFERKEVKDVVAYLRVLVNPEDDVNLLRIINTPRRGFGKKALQTVKTLADERGWSLYSAMTALRWAEDSPLTGRLRETVTEFLELIDYYRETFGSGVKMTETLSSLVDRLGYWAYLITEYPGNDRLAQIKYRNLLTLVQIFERWEKDPERERDEKNLPAFLNRISLITRDDLEDEDNKGRVNLMTIHAAKGLEFDIVFLAGVEDGILPHARALAEAEGNVEEERRLFYVAITRAKKKLLITACRRRRQLKEYVDCAPSPFLEEIPSELIRHHTEESVVAPEEAGEFFSLIKNRLT